MLAVGSGPAAGDSGAHPPRRRLRVLLITCALAAGLLGGGFLWFVGHLPMAEAPPVRKADGIVVLTGSADRISDALDLLANGHGSRLLISGANPITRPREIARLMPAYQRLFDCCVDVRYAALNTIGNATETRNWVKEKGFKSVIVVTSNFHMPRALAELSHQLPDVTLVPYPVVSERMRSESWWSNATTARLLFSEYLKYIVAMARLRLDFA
jgi:uncharacterized SAM-binding protein YcdF (DUF218 family)